MSFEIIKGDLFDPAHRFSALAQGVNTKGIMGGGIAAPFREKFPEMHDDYKTLCAKHETVLPGLLHAYYPATGGADHHNPAVFNLFSQVHPGSDGSYELLERATFLMLREAENTLVILREFEHMDDINYYLPTDSFRVGLPWIGCGIAGLERHNVEHIFRRYLSDSEVEFVLVEQ